MTYKHKTHAVDGDGKIISNADLDFYIDDVCHFVFCSYFISFFCIWSLGNLYGSEIVQLQNRVYHLVEFKDNFELLLMEFLQNKYEIS